MKTSWICIEDFFRVRFQKTFSRRLQVVLVKTNILALVLCLQKTSSRRLQVVLIKNIYSSWPYVFKTFCQYVFKNVFKTSSNHLEIILKAFSKHLAKRRKNVFKTSSRRLVNMSSRNLQDVFKTYHQVKLFLITRPPEIFEAYSTRFWDVLPKRLYTEGFDYNNSQDIWD